MSKAEIALAKLRQAENFKQYDFGRMAKAFAALDKVREQTPEIAPAMKVDDPRWAGEPDKVQWIDPDTGYDCLIVRNQMGALCGYVGLPESHPYFGQNYETPSVAVHGGLTFANFCDPSERDDKICHVPAPGRPDRVWWLGFDCGHFMDLIPGLMRLAEYDTELTYRDLGYVSDEVTGLAKQLKALEAAT